jgi:4'-phosphopantetheinyl transferase
MAHVWRVPLDDVSQLEAYLPTLSAEEQARADRFFRDVHRRRFVIAHGALRRILADYLDVMPGVLEFVTGEHGKPALTPIAGPQPAAVEFNLSHSGDLALVAVTRANPVGVDVEQWDEGVECLELAERFFSPNERRALRALAKAPNHVVAGFFAAWTRKEAYLKATGHGIVRGLHHFDVTLAPGEPARLVADRLDRDATERWTMTELAPAEGYSAALVVASPLRGVQRFAL